MPGSKLVDAGGVVPESVIPNWAQLIADFPFLDSPASGKAHDLGPYELKQEVPSTTDVISQEPKAKSQKLIVNGQILILHGDKIYTITGLEVGK